MKFTLKNKLAAIALPAFALFGATTTTEAAAYIKIGDIKGEATDSGHEEWINLESMSSPIFRSVPEGVSGSQRSRGSTTLGDIVVVKELDKSSPKLAEAVCNGTHIQEVEIVFTKDVTGSDGTTKQEPYLTYKLKNVIVTSYKFHGKADNNPPPPEEFSLNYTEIEWSYTPFDPKTGAKGSPVEASWKVEEGTS